MLSLCRECGREIEHPRRLLGCKMICIECEEAEGFTVNYKP